MKLRHLLAPVAITALAVAPLAATTTANAADDHAKTYVDTDQVVPANAVNITKVKVFRTASDYRATVSYKSYDALKSTRYSVAIGVYADGDTSGNLLDLRIDPTGKASLLAYGIDDGDLLVKSYCQGNKVFSGKNTLTFVIAKGCFYTRYSPAQVIAGTKHYSSAAAYAKGGPVDPYLNGNTETATSDIFRSDQSDGWDWGGPAFPAGAGRGQALTRLHM